MTLWATAQDKIVISGRVLDYKTRTDVVGAKVTVLTPDSTELATEIASNRCMDGDKEWYQSDFNIVVPHIKDASYMVCVTAVGYKPWYKNIKSSDMAPKAVLYKLDNILLASESTLLREAVVSATKVKFYHRGDTVVYNADAFVLSEGSMLDALINQMPGVEIKSNGDIYHNGRLVRELLLNGKAMFGKDGKVLRENLPTYMVKQIEVYDRQTDEARFLGDDSERGKLYVMDVRLKKEYTIGWVANLEAGSGWGKDGNKYRIPYMGRLFTMRFTDHSRLTLYGSANNLNETRKPGQDDGWEPSDTPEGVRTRQEAGIDYVVDDRLRKWDVKGNFSFSHDIFTNNTASYRTNFLSTGSTNDRISESERNRNRSLRTAHELNLTWNRFRLSVSPAASYQSCNIYSGYESETYGTALLNKYHVLGLRDGTAYQVGTSMRGVFKLPRRGESLVVNAKVSFANSRIDRFNRYTLDYGNGQSDRSDQYYKGYPDHTLAFDAGATWERRLAKGLFGTLSYEVSHTDAQQHSALYLLDQLAGYEQGELGWLPSQVEYAASIDLSNSYISKKRSATHSPLPDARTELSLQQRQRALVYPGGRTPTAKIGAAAV